MFAILFACAEPAEDPPRVLAPASVASDVRPVVPVVPPDAPTRDPVACDAARAALAAAQEASRVLAARAGVAQAQALAAAQDALARCNADAACAGDPKQRAARFVDVHEAQVTVDGARRPLAEADAAVYGARVAMSAACGGTP